MSTETQTNVDTHKPGLREKLIYGIVLGFVGLSSTGLGFAATLSETKKDDSQYQARHKYNIALNVEATRLARRALAIGSVYAMCGVGLISYGIWSITGASNFQEFRAYFAGWIPHRYVKPTITPDMYDWDYLKRSAKQQWQLLKNSKQLAREKMEITKELREASPQTVTEEEIKEVAKAMAYEAVLGDSSD